MGEGNSSTPCSQLLEISQKIISLKEAFSGSETCLDGWHVLSQMRITGLGTSTGYMNV